MRAFALALPFFFASLRPFLVSFSFTVAVVAGATEYPPFATITFLALAAEEPVRFAVTETSPTQGSVAAAGRSQLTGISRFLPFAFAFPPTLAPTAPPKMSGDLQV